MNEQPNSPGDYYNSRRSGFSKNTKSDDNISIEKQLRNINTTDNMDHIDVDYYLTNVSKLLEKNNFNLNSRMFMDNLINTLDNLLGGDNKFNRALFTHVLDFGNHKKDSVILL
jgi:hypothetical protein